MNKLRNKLVGATLLSMLAVPMIIGVLHVPIGLKAITEADISAEKESISMVNSVPRPGENIVVTKENFSGAIILPIPKISMYIHPIMFMILFFVIIFIPIL